MLLKTIFLTDPCDAGFHSWEYQNPARRTCICCNKKQELFEIGVIQKFIFWTFPGTILVWEDVR